MGNCNGIFSKCTGGEEVDKIPKGDVKKAVEKNKELDKKKGLGASADVGKYTNNGSG